MPDTAAAATDPAAIRQWLTVLHGRSPGLIHICSTRNWTGRACADIDQAVEYAAALDRGGAEGVYVRTTTLRGPLPEGSRGHATDTLAVPGMWADLDIAGPGHKTNQALPPDTDAARSIITTGALPEPTLWVHSGGGLYPWWLLDTPHLVDADDDLAAAGALSTEWQAVLGAAADRLGWHYGTGVGDLARVLRIPGTVNRKAGLARPCRIIGGSATRYTLDELRQALTAAQAAAPPPPAPTRPAGNPTPARPAPARTDGDLRPGDDFNQRADWAHDILEPAGWRRLYDIGPVQHWQRPGKDGPGNSATINALGTDHLHVFTDAVPELPAGNYSKFEAWAHLNHAADFTTAARALGAAGYGSPPTTVDGAAVNAELLELAGLDPAAGPPPFDSAPAGGSRRRGGRKGGSSGFVDPFDGLLAQKFVDAIEDQNPFAVDVAERLYRYTSGVWRPDGENAIHRRAAELLGDEYRTGHANTAVKLFRIREPLFTDDTTDTRYLNLPNGLLDWRTGELRPHDPAVPSTIRIPVPWDPGATCPTITTWLGQVFPPDALEFALEIVGYTLLNDNPLHKAILLFGAGRNGKGTFLRLLKTLIGAVNVAAVTPQSLDENRFRAAELWGKLANLVGDVDPRIFKATETFKQITGGDMITAERKYGQPFTFHARATMIAAFNALPRTADTSEGFFSRWIVVPFTAHFPAGVADPTLDDRLQAPDELRGLLVAAVAGLQRVMARRAFQLPASVEEQTQAYRQAADPVRAFLGDDGLAGDGQSFVSRRDLYQRYTAWCGVHGHHPLSAASLYERLVAAAADVLGVQITPHKSHGTRGWTGLALTPLPAEWADQTTGRRW